MGNIGVNFGAIGEEFTTSTDEGRCVSWSNGKDAYFLTLVMDDHGHCHAWSGII